MTQAQQSVLKVVSSQRCFGGWQHRYQHPSAVLGCAMTFSVYLPPQAELGSVPVVFWLSGLTCTDGNFVIKAGAQRYAAELGMAIVCPDTSPRGLGLPGEDESYDLGTGAGFYVNATQEPWAAHYRMYDYVCDELPAVLAAAELPLQLDQCGISGHSMGGHGALVLGLRNPGRYVSVSAFAPIVAPSQVPWGQKAFTAYLGEDRESWRQYDACALVGSVRQRRPMLIDQGTQDEFLAEQLRPALFETACQQHGHPLTIRQRADYDHSYFFIASFIGDHLRFHARVLAA